MASTSTKATLEQRASEFLEFAQLRHRLSGFPYYATGSFRLQTMAWPDIDLNVLYAPLRRAEVLALGAECLRQLSPSWFELRCTEKEPDSPGHFFLGFEVHWKRMLWNVDIWFLSEAEYEAGRRWLRRTDRQIDPSRRQLIVDLKRFLMRRKVYPNGIPSIDVYRAILEQDVDRSSFGTWFQEYQRRQPRVSK
ncbi:hypothetical protein JXA88_05745 [Candidatus Fermentibacteria bacterium]|nr:hypothetical protein [Candidatus Fermentibacteria bacterium]